MYEIDKKRFGAFVAQLRKEKGYTQKELAQQLYVSDKAVSKWETGSSVPDTALLIPLAERLEVSVTELLLGRRMSQDAIEAAQVERVVKAAISYPEAAPGRAYRTAGKWKLWYGLTALWSIAGLVLGYLYQEPTVAAQTGTMLSLIFGAYFCFFARTALPPVYDQTRLNFVSDGAFRMNLPGVTFHNANWLHVLHLGRIWACTAQAVFPWLDLALTRWLPTWWIMPGQYLALAVYLGSLLVPLYRVCRAEG